MSSGYTLSDDMMNNFHRKSSHVLPRLLAASVTLVQILLNYNFFLVKSFGHRHTSRRVVFFNGPFSPTFCSQDSFRTVRQIDSQCFDHTSGFCSICRRHNRRGQSSTMLGALTERQMQFWEDVEEGLKDVEEYYTSKDGSGMNIGRIYDFAKSAQGITSPPLPAAPGQQPSEEHVNRLKAQPFWEVRSTYTNENGDEALCFPWADKLEEQSSIIINEFLTKLEKDKNKTLSAKGKGGSAATLFSGDSVWQNEVMGKGWSAFRLQRLGEWNIPNCQEFPQTYELLKSLNIPLAVRGVCFARQGSNSGVAPHSDGRNFILTAHLGLKIPKEGCWIKVGDEQRGWEEGKLTILDTSFEHSTGNSSDEDRHVLIIDFWHPELTEAERAGLEFVYSLRNKFESGKVPFRTPRSLQKEKEGQGLAGLFSMFGGRER